MFDDLPEPDAPPPTAPDAARWPDEVAAELAGGVPGSYVAAPLAVLDPARLSATGRVDVLVAIERQVAWLQGMQQRVLAAMADNESSPDKQWSREDVACSLRVTAETARRRMAVAQQLVGKLPATLAMLDRGRIGYLQAMWLAEATYRFDGPAVTDVETAVLRDADQPTFAEFKRSLDRIVLAADTADAEQQRADAMEQRRICRTPRPDGMAELWALLPAEGTAALLAAVDALASVTSADDQRTADQRRADALVDLGVAALHDPNLPRAQGIRPSIEVTVALSTLLGCDDKPGELAGHGPIPAGVARRIAADETGTWRRLVTDPLTGVLLDYGQDTYRPPADLAAFVIARDRTRTFAGCARPARRCDLDHRLPNESGGPTCPSNIDALCRRHHMAKHEAGWQVRRSDDGSSIWTSPTGHVYRRRPPPFPPRRHGGARRRATRGPPVLSARLARPRCPAFGNRRAAHSPRSPAPCPDACLPRCSESGASA